MLKRVIAIIVVVAIILVIIFSGILGGTWVEKDGIRVQVVAVLKDGTEKPMKMENLLAIGQEDGQIIATLKFKVQIKGDSPDYYNYNILCSVPTGNPTMTVLSVNFLPLQSPNTNIMRDLQYNQLMTDCDSTGGGHRTLPFDNQWYDLITTNINKLITHGWETGGGWWYFDMAWFNRWAVEAGHDIGAEFSVQISYGVWWTVLEDPAFEYRGIQRLPPNVIMFTIAIVEGAASLEGQLEG